MRTRVQKWGNSLAVRIPKFLAGQVGLDENIPVEMWMADGKVMIEPAPDEDFTLDQLLAGVTEANLHREVETGTAVGNEAW
ncbi:MAG: AbrB/MazE/SpoVT family DNA-binding domain-containing protein [Chloroflexota bacterium]|nr:MAG: AbrB/MazE/SpoVT family DNA-binding domain-containing protein [Chloroflexota bacterium]